MISWIKEMRPRYIRCGYECCIRASRSHWYCWHSRHRDNLRQTNNWWLVNCWSSQFQTADDRHIHGVIYLIILSLVEWELNHSLSLLVWALNRRDHRAVCRILCHYCNHLSYYIMMSTAPKYTVAFRGEAPHIMDILQIHCHGLK